MCDNIRLMGTYYILKVWRNVMNNVIEKYVTKERGSKRGRDFGVGHSGAPVCPQTKKASVRQ